MVKPIKFFVMCGVICAALSGCTTKESAKVAAAVDQDFINAYDAFELAKTPRAQVAMVIPFLCLKGFGWGPHQHYWNIAIIYRLNLKRMQE